MDITKIRRTNYSVTWNSIDLGGLNKIDLSKLKMKFGEVKVGTMGDVKLDDRYLGLEEGAEIGVQVREVTRAMIELAFPWFSGTTAVTLINLTPPVNTLISNAYAQALGLHPIDKGATINEDIVLVKTVPVTALISRDGTADDVWDMTFRVFPDPTAFPALSYGTVHAST